MLDINVPFEVVLVSKGCSTLVTLKSCVTLAVLYDMRFDFLFSVITIELLITHFAFEDSFVRQHTLCITKGNIEGTVDISAMLCQVVSSGEANATFLTLNVLIERFVNTSFVPLKDLLVAELQFANATLHYNFFSLSVLNVGVIFETGSTHEGLVT